MALQRQGGARLTGDAPRKAAALTARHVAQLCEELDALVAGWRVKDVQGLPPRDVLLVLEPPGDPGDGPPVLRLRLAADPNAPRLHLQQGRVHKHDGPVGPFFQRLADELLGATLQRIGPVRGDRMALAEFKSVEGKRALMAELFGRRANLVLLGSGDRVLAMAAAPPARAGEAPRLQEGRAWQPPGAGRPPTDPGPSIAESFPAPSEDPPGKVKDRAPLSWRVEAALGGDADEARGEDARRKLKSRLKRRIGRARGLLRGLETKAEAAAGAERVMQDGELLKAALGTFARGEASVTLQDWYAEGTPQRTIELDPRLGPKENVERIFTRYHKLVRARENVADELARAASRLQELEDLRERADDPEEDAEALDRDAVARGLLDPQQVADQRKRKAPEPRKPYLRFVGSRGSEILVGRSARDNDTLSIRIARGSDTWLHTADVPGSHVVLRTPRGQEPDGEEVLDAAHLAIHFSPVRGTDRAPVHVVAAKHVHKPKGAKPGLVNLSGGRILEVRMQQDRLEALLRGNQRG